MPSNCLFWVKIVQQALLVGYEADVASGSTLGRPVRWSFKVSQKRQLAKPRFQTQPEWPKDF